MYKMAVNLVYKNIGIISGLVALVLHLPLVLGVSDQHPPPLDHRTPPTDHRTPPLDHHRRDMDQHGPVFLAEPGPRLSFHNTRGLLVPCSAYGRPAPHMDWRYSDGREVVDVRGVLRIFSNNSLYFPPFGEDRFTPSVHNGKFRCVASNSVGTIVSRTVTVKAVLVNKYRTYNIHVNDVYVTSGNTAVMTCTVNPYFMREYVTFRGWTHSGTQVKTGGRFRVLENGELHVQSVTSQDSYVMYSCVTVNVITSEVKTSDPASIHVIEPVSSPPTIDIPLRRVTILEGQPAELPCVASGYPQPTYTWSRNDQPLTPDHSRVTLAGGNLLINPTIIRDDGKYTCIATNKFGASTSTVFLTVKSPLSAHITPTEQVIDVGAEAVFNCSVYGNPVDGVVWFKDGEVLGEEGGRAVFTAPGRIWLRNVQRDDRGMYQCMVANGEGEEAQATAQLELGVSKPIFIERFQDAYIRPGSSASLRCVVNGNPTPNIRWTLDDGPIPTDDRYRVATDVTGAGDVISYVNVTHVRVEDGGIYRCTATNHIAEESHMGNLNVYGIPYIRPLHNITAVANHVMVMRCYVSGYPIKEVTWLKDGVELPTNHRQHVSRDGTLSVDDVTRGHDDGPYTCRASNYEGQHASRHVYVYILEPPVIDSFKFPERKSGDRVSISCVVSSGDLPISFTWYKDGQPIPADLGVLTQSTGSYSSLMSIGNATPLHNGNYTCRASNRAASSNYTAHFHVDVPPRWVVEPSDSFVILGKSAILNCQTDGTPEPEVTWMKAKGDEPGNYEKVIPTNTTGGDGGGGGAGRIVKMSNGSLSIREARAEDHGYYLCHASNGVPRDLSKVVQLVVHIPATFDVVSRNYTSRLRGNLSVECEARGDRPLSLAWSFNGRPLNWRENPRLEVAYYNTRRGRGSKLLLRPTSRHDSGIYVCTAKNMFGSDVTMIDLLVQETPEGPLQVESDDVTSRSVRLRWKMPYDGNSQLTGYIIQYKNKSDSWRPSNLRNVTVSSRKLTDVIDNLRPAFTYHFRVIAKNSLGQGQPSHVITVMTSEEAPTGSPRNVAVYATGSSTINVTWQEPLKEEQNGKLTGYYIGYRQHNKSAPYMYVTKAVLAGAGGGGGALRSYSVEVDVLDKFTRYDVHVQAFNQEGSGPPSDDVTVLTLEDVPSESPQNVQATPLSSTSLLVVWSPPPLYTLHGVLQGYKLIYQPVRNDEDEMDADVLVTSQLTAAIYSLSKYTNYSVQVLAYTRKGEGVRSHPIYIMTSQDVPDRPADIKAVAAGKDAILVSWRPPLHPNGVITKYNLYMHDADSQMTAMETKLELPANKLTYRAESLTRNHKYSFRVGAATLVGDGESTHSVTATTVDNALAQIASFASVVLAIWQTEVVLPCDAVGDPSPSIKWFKRGMPIRADERIEISTNGSLHISQVTTRDAGIYECRAENMHGADEISVKLVVQAPPRAPILSVAVTTSSSIQVNWKSGSNGGSPIKGFKLVVKKDHDHMKEVTLDRDARTYTAEGLRCGSRYHVNVRAFNGVGEGPDSNEVTVRTNGSAPIMPPQSMIIDELNATFVDLDLGTWLSGGCPVTSYDIRYRYWGHSQWETVDSYITPQTTSYRVDLHPATWYVMRVTAQNDAGATDAILKFATPTYHGGTIEPIRVVHRNELGLHQKPYVMIPLIGCLVLTVVVLVGFFLYCRRRRQKLAYKAENETNLRRDLTAETSLMSELDKRINVDTESPTPASKVTNKGETRVNKTIQRGSITEEDDSNQYATLRRHVQFHNKQRVVEDVVWEKADSHKEDSSSPPRSPTESIYQNFTPPGKQDYRLILNPQLYASLDSTPPSSCTPPHHTPPLHTPSCGPGPHTTTTTNAHNHVGRNRNSIASSGTTESSNREELARALDNASVIYYNDPNKRQSDSTDSGVRNFTQSPPMRVPDGGHMTVPTYQRQAHIPFTSIRYRPTPYPRSGGGGGSPSRKSGAYEVPAAPSSGHSSERESPCDLNDVGPFHTGVSPSLGVFSSDMGIPSSNERIPASKRSIPSLASGVPSLASGIPSLASGVPSLASGIPSLSSGIPSSASGIPPGVILYGEGDSQSDNRHGSPSRRILSKRGPPPPTPPRVSSRNSSANSSPSKSKGAVMNTEECEPLFNVGDKPSPPDEEGDQLLEKYYGMLRDGNQEPDPGPSDDVMVLDERPYTTSYSDV